MDRTKLFRYKLSEFSHLSGIDTYRLKKLDESGQLKANIYNGRRYYDDVALALSALYRDDFDTPTIHDIKLEIGKLILMIDRHDVGKVRKDSYQVEFLHERDLVEKIDDISSNNIDIADALDTMCKYLYQIQLLLIKHDKDNEDIDMDNPIITNCK